MRIIILSWEYPPRIVGQLANYVKKLATQLARSVEKTWVITYHDFLTGEYNETEGVKTFRVTNPVHTHIGVLTWVLTLNQEVERTAANIFFGASRQVDLIDAHDWHFIPAAVTLKKALDMPFVYSVESLEEHRSHGASAPFNMSIKSIEWLGMYEASKLIVKSEWMRDEVVRLYNVPKDKVSVISPEYAKWLKGIVKTYKSIVEDEPSR
jgi:glycosyltransferase involved in cell wall biosynthesis